jgi:hypothetical protein
MTKHGIVARELKREASEGCMNDSFMGLFLQNVSQWFIRLEIVAGCRYWLGKPYPTGSTMKHTITIDIGNDVANIPTMESMSPEEYSSYVEEALFWVDHHDVLRSTVGDYAIATSAEQIELLITYLKDRADDLRRAGH